MSTVSTWPKKRDVPKESHDFKVQGGQKNGNPFILSPRIFSPRSAESAICKLWKCSSASRE